LQKRALAAARKPRVDDRPLWDVMFGIWGYPAVLVAHELKFFEMLAEKPLTLDEVCAVRQIERRPAHAILAVCTSLGLIALRKGSYRLTPLSREYLLPSSAYYVGWRFDQMRLIMTVWSPDSLREAVLTNRPQGVFSDPAGVFAAWHGECVHARHAHREHRLGNGVAAQAGFVAQPGHARYRRGVRRPFYRSGHHPSEAQGYHHGSASGLRDSPRICTKLWCCGSHFHAWSRFL
jgi:hypothetical protein